jgi:hypothetical protein
MSNQSDPQTLQTAIAAANNAHTGIHQAIAELKRGSVEQGKQLLARQIAVLANALMIL